MLDLGLTQRQLETFYATLTGSHRARTTLEVLDRDEHVIDTIEDVVMTGSVDVDSKSRPDRTLQVQFVNEGKRFHFAPGGAGDTTMFADNFIRARRQIYVPQLAELYGIRAWVDVPLFTGPITSVDRDADTIQVTAAGKESLMLEPVPAWRPAHYPKGLRVTDAIRRILAAQGERRIDIPTLPARLRKPVSIGRHTEPWKVARRLADSLDRQLFYDGRGKARLRHLGAHSVWTFRTGEGANVVGDPPARTYTLDEMRNTVEVLGPENEGPAKRLRFVAMPNRGNPLSPWSLARNGEPRYVVETIELDHAKNLAVLRSRGERELEDLLRSAISVDFDAKVVPHLEPGDMIALREDGEHTAIRLRTFTIPLDGEAMSIGANRRPRSKGKRDD